MVGNHRCLHSSLLGSTLAFLIGRQLGKQVVNKWLSAYQSRLLLALDETVQKEGPRALILIHLAHLPEALKSYGLSILRIDFCMFAWTKCVGGLPIVTFFAYSGATTRDIAAVLHDEQQMSSTQMAVLIVGVLCLLVVLAVIGYHVRQSMRRLEKAASLELEREEDETGGTDSDDGSPPPALQGATQGTLEALQAEKDGRFGSAAVVL